MASGSFDFAPLLAPSLPPPAAKWTGFPKYNFTGGNNDADHVPVDRLIAAATAVLAREGATLATYGLESGPLGYRPLREFLAGKLKRTAGISCAADEILITSGSLQALDLVNGALLARGDTVLIEQESYQGALTRLTRLGVNAVGIPLDRDVVGIVVAAGEIVFGKPGPLGRRRRQGGCQQRREVERSRGHTVSFFNSTRRERASRHAVASAGAGEASSSFIAASLGMISPLNSASERISCACVSEPKASISTR